MRSRACSWWSGISLLLSGVAMAADPQTQPAPDLALLEYLGGMVEDDGQWVGPDDMGAVRSIDVAVDEEAATTQVVR